MIPLGATATNPQTGHTIVLTEKGWVDAGSPQMGSTLSPTDQDGLKQLAGDAEQAQWLAHKADQFRDIQQGSGSGDQVNTGWQNHDLHIPLPFIDQANLNPLPMIGAATNPRFASMESISNQAWAHMRPTGSGPLRMPEVEGFQQAFPSIEHSPQANAAIAQRLDQDAAFASTKLRFIDDFMRGNRGSYADANAAWEAQQQSPGNGSVIYGQGSPQQGQPVTQGQQGYAQQNPASGPMGGAQNPYYATPQGQAPQGAYQVGADGRLQAPPGQMNMQHAGPATGAGWQVIGVQ